MLGTQPTGRANARPMTGSAIPINCSSWMDDGFREELNPSYGLRLDLPVSPRASAGLRNSGHRRGWCVVWLRSSMPSPVVNPHPRMSAIAFTREERRLRRVSKDEGPSVASWFETREAALLTMRSNCLQRHHALAEMLLAFHVLECTSYPP